MSEPRFIINQDDLTEDGSLKTLDQQKIYNVLMNFGMVVFPSDTCYGLAALPVNADVYEKINSILNRGEEPMSLSFHNIFSVAKYVSMDNIKANLFEHFTPGPLTLICDARGDVHDYSIAIQKNTKSIDGTIGVRIPDSRIERDIAAITPYPITSTAVRDEDNNIVQDFDKALEIVSTGMKKIGFLNWAAIKGNSFLSQHSTVVFVDKITNDIYVKREGQIPKESLDKVKNLYSQFLNNRG